MAYNQRCILMKMISRLTNFFSRRYDVIKDDAFKKKSSKENQLDDTPQTILDLRKAGSRNRSSDMEKIIKEMELGSNSANLEQLSNKDTTNNDEDDLIALIDSQI